jgi:hypothetical protein
VYKDSLFYDITAWNMPLAFGLPFSSISNPAGGIFGKKIDSVAVTHGVFSGSKSAYGYLIDWDEYFAPAAVYELLNQGILVKVATNQFEIPVFSGPKKFKYGTILVPLTMQTKSADEIFSTISLLTEKYGLKTYSLETGNSSTGSDPGSSKVISITKPSIAMIVGPGASALDAGETWFLLDQRMNIPATHLEQTTFNRVDMSKYNTLILAGGTYTDLNKDKLKAWVQGGGTLVLTEEAITWAVQAGISEVKMKKAKSPVDSTQRVAYVQREQVEGAQQMTGAIFGADADLTHPLAYGYNQNTVSFFKANKIFMEKSKNAYATPFYYKDKPLQSGWASQQNLDAAKNSAAVVVNVLGSGRVINIADDPSFRAFWLGGTKLLMNAIFFGRIIDAASARTGGEE